MIWMGLHRRLRSLSVRITHQIAESAPAAFFRDRRYYTRLRRHRTRLPSLGPMWSGVARELKAAGVMQTHLRELALPNSDRLVLTAQALVNTWALRFRLEAASGVSFVTVPSDEIAAHPDLYQFGLLPDLLKLAEAYIGLPVAYDGVAIHYTVADGREISTREWHRDREDRRMLKLAIYLNDVDTNGGPFQLIPAAAKAEGDASQDSEFYIRGDRRLDFDADPQVRWVTCEGDVGTAVFADTGRCFHRGKPATECDRAAIFFRYFARKPKRPYFCDRTGLSTEKIASLIANLDGDQKAAALWQRALPWWWRIIPTAPV